MANVELTPTSLCGANDGDGCGGVFPRKVEDGLCARCAMLSTLTEGTEEWSKYQAYKQCRSCGKTWKYMTGQTCGSCTLSGGRPLTGPPPANPPQADKAQLAADAANLARGHALSARLTKSGAPAFAPGGPLAGGKTSGSTTLPSTQVMYPLESTYAPTHTRKNKPSSTEILIERANCVRSEENSQVTISWPDDPLRTEFATISHGLFAMGRTKRVYELRIQDDEQPYVAKRFFKVRTGENNLITAEENEDFLECELIRLQVLDWFIRSFLKHAGPDGVNVEHHKCTSSHFYDFKFLANLSYLLTLDITVSEAFLIHEIGDPSDPSGLPSEDPNTSVWLVEPKRTRSVRKFCGTLGHPERNDKVGKTIAALCHWIYVSTRKTEVYADIQGSFMTIDGQETLILFDPMAHTVDQDSGVGDHGEEGIQRFLSEHQCNYICQGLGLVPIADMNDLSKNVQTDTDASNEDSD
ncbi:hypothetical protein H1R20_g1195, partial [Candolleomyces eurysporus]